MDQSFFTYNFANRDEQANLVRKHNASISKEYGIA